jgi:hypothetical protein
MQNATGGLSRRFKSFSNKVYVEYSSITAVTIGVLRFVTFWSKSKGVSHPYLKHQTYTLARTSASRPIWGAIVGRRAEYRAALSFQVLLADERDWLAPSQQSLAIAVHYSCKQNEAAGMASAFSAMRSSLKRSSS